LTDVLLIHILPLLNFISAPAKMSLRVEKIGCVEPWGFFW